jgi:hypothetical protein
MSGRRTLLSSPEADPRVGAADGVVAQGTPERVVRMRVSHTRAFLALCGSEARRFLAVIGSLKQTPCVERQKEKKVGLMGDRGLEREQ